MHQGADSGSRTRDKRLETSYVTTTPYPHDVNICPRRLSSLSESVFQLPITASEAEAVEGVEPVHLHQTLVAVAEGMDCSSEPYGKR